MHWNQVYKKEKMNHRLFAVGQIPREEQSSQFAFKARTQSNAASSFIFIDTFIRTTMESKSFGLNFSRSSSRWFMHSS